MSILSQIPMELWTGVASGAMSFFASLMAMKAKAKAEQQRMLLERHQAHEASMARAESGTAANQKEKRFTRRTIAIAAVLSILVVPVLAGMFGVSVTTGWTELSGGFWPFTGPQSHMIWHQVHGGIVITPLHTHVLMAIVGFYFGSSVAENARVQ